KVRRPCARNADDRVRKGIEANLFTYNVRIRAKTPLPVCMADDSHGNGSTFVVRWLDQPAGRRLDSQRGIELARDVLARCNVPLAVDDEVYRRSRTYCEQAFQGFVGVAKPPERRI